MRFVAVQEPPDTWAVFDTTIDEPTDYAGRVLIGLTLNEARWFVAAANAEAVWPEAIHWARTSGGVSGLPRSPSA